MLLAQSASASSSITMIIAYVILFGAIIYFMTIRPQKKQQKQQQNFKGFQPGASGENKPGEGETVDFSKMSYDELTAYMEANPDAQI